jgi:hypothetical protein
VSDQRGGAAPYLLGGALLVLILLLFFGLADVARAMQARSGAQTALQAAVRAAATAALVEGGGTPAWDEPLARQRFGTVLADNLELDAGGNPGAGSGLVGPVQVELLLLAPGDPDPRGGTVTSPTAVATLRAGLPLLVLTRVTGGPVPLAVGARCRLAWVDGRWRIADG